MITLTRENVDEVAAWCGGRVIHMPPGRPVTCPKCGGTMRWKDPGYEPPYQRCTSCYHAEWNTEGDDQ